MERGKYIVIVGGEGSGKGLQARKLGEYLQDRNINFLKTREPGGTKVGERIREILKQTLPENMNERTELFLFEAARAQLFDKVIVPAIEKGHWAISDRSFICTSAYQGHARGMPLDFVYGANDFATFGYKPDLAFLIDVDPRIGLEKEVEKWEIFSEEMDPEKLEFHNKVRKGYLKEAERMDNFVVIPYLENRPEEMQEQIRSELESRFRI